jgi:hypothetical protein
MFYEEWKRTHQATLVERVYRGHDDGLRRVRLKDGRARHLGRDIPERSCRRRRGKAYILQRALEKPLRVERDALLAGLLCDAAEGVRAPGDVPGITVERRKHLNRELLRLNTLWVMSTDRRMPSACGLLTSI